MFDVIKIEDEPKLPEEWSYDTSLAKVKTLGESFRRYTIEIVIELYQAWRILHLSPSQAAKVRYSKEETHTWKNYCESLSISQKTVYNWFNRAGLPYREETRAGRKPNPSPNIINKELKEQFGDMGCKWVNRLNGNKREIKDKEAIVITSTLEKDIQDVADVLAFNESGGMLVYHGDQSRMFIKRSRAIGYQVWVRK